MLLYATAGLAQISLLNDDQKAIKKIKTGSVISIRTNDTSSFMLHNRFIDSVDQVEFKGVLGSTKDGMISLEFVSARSYYRKGKLMGRHELLFDGIIATQVLKIKLYPNEVVTLTLERERSRNTALLLRSLGMLTFFAAPLVSLDLKGSEAIHSRTYLWTAGSGLLIMGVGAIMMHISKPKTFLIKKVPFAETKKYKRAKLKLH